MFSILSSENQTRVPITVAIVLATLLLALALCAMAVFQVLDEYRMLGAWLARPEPVSTGELRALRQDIGARIIVRSIASAVLLLCTLATLWLQLRQLTVRRALDQVKWLAHNILSSLNQGVITTDQRAIITSINSAAFDLIRIDRLNPPQATRLQPLPTLRVWARQARGEPRLRGRSRSASARSVKAPKRHK